MNNLIQVPHTTVKTAAFEYLRQHLTTEPVTSEDVAELLTEMFEVSFGHITDVMDEHGVVFAEPREVGDKKISLTLVP